MKKGLFTILLPKTTSHITFSITGSAPASDQRNGEVQIFSDPTDPNIFIKNSEAFNIFFFGSIYNTDHLKEILGKREKAEELSGFEIFCKLYTIYGNLAVKFLEGSFFILISRDGQFYSFTDPFSSIPIYSSHEQIDQKYLITNSLFIYRRFFPYDLLHLSDDERMDELLLTDATRLKPASIFNLSTKEIFTYWDLPKEISVFNETQAIEMIQSALRKSVKNRFNEAKIRNESVGVILSGGIDSSAITALVSELTPKFSTFCLGTKSANEFKYAKSVADHLKTDHHEIYVEDHEIIDLIPEVVKTLEIVNPRFVEYIIPIILVYKYAKSYAQCFFNGYGADILFGSYVPANVTPEENYLFVLSEYKTTEDSNEYSSHIASSNGIKIFYPYWDKEFISCALKIDPCLKIKNSTTKYVLRKAFSQLLPELNVWRPKSGIHESTGVSKIFSHFLGVDHLDFSTQMKEKRKYLASIFQSECISEEKTQCGNSLAVK